MLLKNDQFEQKDSLQKRLAQRKLRKKKNAAEKKHIDLDNLSQNKGNDGEFYHRGGIQSVMIPKNKEDQSELTNILDKMQIGKQNTGNNDQYGDPVVVEEDDDLPPINNNSTVPGSSSGENFNGIIPNIANKHRPS